MDALLKSVDALKASVTVQSPRKERSRSNSIDSTTSESTMADAGDFSFTYEEEADPEVFFVPYVWEVIVCAITAGLLEWNKRKIEVFPLLTSVSEGFEDDVADPNLSIDSASAVSVGSFAKDISDVV